MSAMTGVTGTTATPQASGTRKRKRQMHVTYTETTELDRSTGKLRDVIVIEDTPPPGAGTPNSNTAPSAAPYAPPPAIRTRAQAAAAAAALTQPTHQPPLKKRKREPADDLAQSTATKKPAVGNGLVKQWQTSATGEVSITKHSFWSTTRLTMLSVLVFSRPATTYRNQRRARPV